MKLPRRQFLHLAASAAALYVSLLGVCSSSAWAQGRAFQRNQLVVAFDFHCAGGRGCGGLGLRSRDGGFGGRRGYGRCRYHGSGRRFRRNSDRRCSDGRSGYSSGRSICDRRGYAISIRFKQRLPAFGDVFVIVLVALMDFFFEPTVD